MGFGSLWWTEQLKLQIDADEIGEEEEEEMEEEEAEDEVAEEEGVA